MIIKIPLYFEVSGGIPPQHSQEVISILSKAFEEFVINAVSGKPIKEGKDTIAKKLALKGDVREALEAFANDGGEVTVLSKEYAQKRLMKSFVKPTKELQKSPK